MQYNTTCQQGRAYRKRTAAWAALACLLVLAFAFAVQALNPASAFAEDRAYGQLCSKYESGNNPGLIDAGCAYGAYQMSTDNAYAFAKQLKSSSKSKLAKWGKTLISAASKDKSNGKCYSGCSFGPKFDSAWKSIAKESKDAFFTAQYNYCIEAYYEPALKYWKKVTSAFNVNNYTDALKSVLFSTAIQHGPYGSADRIFKLVVKSLGGLSGVSEKKLIDAIYYERSAVTKKKPGSGAVKISSNSTSKKYGIAGKYLSHFYSCSSAVQIGVYNRLHNNERADAQAMLAKLDAGQKYTITYKLKGGKQASGQKKTYTETTETFKLKSPTRVGYKFKGWYSTKNYASGTRVKTIEQGTTGDVTLYAKWKARTNFKVKVKSSVGLVVRADKSKTADPVKVLPKGTKVKIASVSGKWGKLKDGSGWIMLCYTKAV